MQEQAEAFRTGLIQDLQARADKDPNLAAFAQTLGGLDCTVPRDITVGPKPGTVSAHLETVLAGLPNSVGFAQAIRSAASAVNWYQIFQEGTGIDPALAKGLVAGQVAGRVGLVSSSNLYVGLFLLAPNITYPLHQHEATELYYVVSGTLTLQHGRFGEPFAVKPGEWSVTLPNRTHALTTRDEPCLIVYTWIDQIDSENWWWEQDTNGAWQRICWKRQSDGSWQITRSEPVTEQILKDAFET